MIQIIQFLGILGYILGFAAAISLIVIAVCAVRIVKLLQKNNTK